MAWHALAGGLWAGKILPVLVSGLFFWPSCIFNNIAWFVFGFVLGLFFPQLRVFNNFSALFLGLFGFVFGGQPFVFSNFSALFFKKLVFLSHAFLWPKTTPNGFSHLRALCRPARLLNPLG
ncbi:MAG: hypothetical protein WB819_01980 [Terriglobia bacterium]